MCKCMVMPRPDQARRKAASPSAQGRQDLWCGCGLSQAHTKAADLRKSGCGVQTRLAELEAKCLSYTLSLRRAEQQQAADKSMIASLSQSCSKLRAEVGLLPHSQHPTAFQLHMVVLNPHGGKHLHGQGCHECLP